MAFSEKELKQIERLVDDLCRRRAPEHLKEEIQLGYRIKGHEVLIYEARPGWSNPSDWIESKIAKLRYVRSDNEWRLYWRRASGKWWLYEPHSRSRTLSALVKEIDVDSDGCFFG